MNVDPEVERTSAAGQSMERFASILRLLAQRSRTGSRLTDVAVGTGLSKSTAHRLLANLVAQKLVEVDEGTGLFYLSFEMFALSATAANRFGLVEIARPSLDWLQQRTGDTVFLSVRSGEDAMCIDRAVGDFPIKVLTLSVGDRRPLGVGAASLALLSALDDQRIVDILAANQAALKPFANFTPPRLWAMIEQTRVQGFSYNDGQIISGMQALGIVIASRQEPARIALSIAAIRERMDETRRATLVADLREASTVIAGRLDEVATMRLAP